MTGDEMSSLLDEVCSFLKSCGGPYEVITAEMQVNLIYSLASGQYVIKYNGQGTEYFAAYWRIHEQDLPEIEQRKRPSDIYTGPLIYVVEAASRNGSFDMVRNMKDTGATEALWHRRDKLKRCKLIRKGEPLCPSV